MTSSHLRPNVVTTKLRAADIVVLPAGTPWSREGVRVSRGYRDGLVTVMVCIDAPSQCRRVTEAIVEALETQGYSVEANGTDGSILSVTRPA